MASPEKIKLTLEITNPSVLKFLKEKQTIKASLELGGADFNKLKKLKQEGLKIKTQLELTGKGFDQLMKWQREGIKIKASIEGLPSLSAGGKSSSGSTAPQTLSQQQLNASEVARLNQAYANAEKERIAQTDRLFKAYFAAQEQLVKATQLAAKNAEKVAQANQKAAEMLVKDLSKMAPGSTQTIKSFTRGFGNSVPIEGPDADMLRRRDLARAQETKFQNEDLARIEQNLARENAEYMREEAQRIRNARQYARQQRNNATSAAQNFRVSQTGAPRLFRANTIEDRAITEVLRSPSFFNLDEVIEDVAFRNNTTPGRLTSALTVPRQGQGFGPLNPNRRKFFDPSRVDLKDKQLQKELGFSFLFGGPTALAGSLAGESIAPGGAFLGGAAAQVGVNLATRGFETLIETLRKAAEAGLIFNESILGISATLQATSRVTGPGGKELSFGDQVNFQQGRAREIQTAARKKLLRIGIGGEKEATLVQAIVAGAAQRGIQLTPEEAATLAERIGGAVQAQRPELLNNASQLRRDVEDLLSGLPNRTVLGSLVKGFAPNLGTAASGKALIQASQGLAQFPAVLAGSKNNPVVALNSLNSALDNLNTTIGDKLITTLIPGINSLTEALSNPELTAGLTNLVGLIGTLTSEVVKGVTRPENRTSVLSLGDDKVSGEKKFNTLLKLASSPQSAISTIFGDLTNAGIEEFKKVFNPKAKEVEGKAETRANTELEELLKSLGEGSKSIDLAEEATGKNSIGARIAILNSIPEVLDRAEKEAIDKIESDFKEAVVQPGAKPTDLFKSRDEQIKAAKASTNQQKIGLLVQAQSVLEERAAQQASLIDTSTSGGQLLAAQFQRKTDSQKEDLIRQEIFRRGIEVENRKDLLAQAKEDAKDPANKVSAEAIKKLELDVAAATGKLTEAEAKLIKVRQDEISTIDASANALQNRINKEKGAFNPGTFTGQQGLLNLESQSIKVERNRISQARTELSEKIRNSTNPTEIANFKNQLIDLGIDSRVASNREEILGQSSQDLRLDRAQAIRGFKNISRDDVFARQQFGLTKESQALQGDELANASRSLTFAFQELAAKASNTGDSLISAQNALKDFANDIQLRKLGKQGSIIAAAQAALDSGSSEAFVSGQLLGTGVSLLDVIDPDQSGSFKKKLAEEQLKSISNKNQPERAFQEETVLKNKLETDLKLAEIAQRRIPLEEEALAIQAARNDLSRRQLQLDQDKADAAEEDRQNQVDLDKYNRSKQFKGDNSPEGLKIQREGQKAYENLLKKDKVEPRKPNPYDSDDPIYLDKSPKEKEKIFKEYTGQIISLPLEFADLPTPEEINPLDPDGNLKNMGFEIPSSFATTAGGTSLPFGDPAFAKVQASGFGDPLMYNGSADARVRAIMAANKDKKYAGLKNPSLPTDAGSFSTAFAQGQLDATFGYIPKDANFMGTREAKAYAELFKFSPRNIDTDNVFNTGEEALRKIKPGFASTAVAQAAGEGHKEMVGKVSSLEQGLKNLVQAAMEAPQKTGAAFQSALQNSFGN